MPRLGLSELSGLSGLCRVCMEECGEALGCMCKTSVAHGACIQRWVSSRQLGASCCSPWTCEVCRHHFVTGEPAAPAAPEELVAGVEEEGGGPVVDESQSGGRVPPPWLVGGRDGGDMDARTVTRVVTAWMHLSYAACVTMVVYGLLQLHRELLTGASATSPVSSNSMVWAVQCAFGVPGYNGLWAVWTEACVFALAAIVVFTMPWVRPSRRVYRLVCTRALACMVVILLCHLTALLYVMMLGGAAGSSKTGVRAGSLQPPRMHGLMLPSSMSAASLLPIQDYTLHDLHNSSWLAESLTWHMCTQQRLCAQNDGCLGYPTDGTRSVWTNHQSLNATFPPGVKGLEHVLTSLVVSESAMLLLGVMCTHALLSDY
jgi:hypothetical protein